MNSEDTTKNNNSAKLVLKDIKNSKICIIYVYYERKNETKNQTNLSYFSIFFAHLFDQPSILLI